MRKWLRSVTIVTVVAVLYFLLPLRRAEAQGLGWLRFLMFAAGLALLVKLVAVQVRRATSPGVGAGEQITMLLTLVTIVVASFAGCYYRLSYQFNGLHTKLDSLYFTVVTLCTVGYGDITPVGQAARGIVIAQMLFDLVILTSGISIIIGGLVRRGQGP